MKQSVFVFKPNSECCLMAMWPKLTPEPFYLLPVSRAAGGVKVVTPGGFA